MALLPVTHPLATQINLELTDLREEPFIGYPSYLETTRAVLRSQKQPSPGPSFRPEEPLLPDSI